MGATLFSERDRRKQWMPSHALQSLGAEIADLTGIGINARWIHWMDWDEVGMTVKRCSEVGECLCGPELRHLHFVPAPVVDVAVATALSLHLPSLPSIKSALAESLSVGR
jgi:hypothetical protein